MKSTLLACGHTLIPYIYKGQENLELSSEHLELAKRSLAKLQIDRQTHRLSDNYRYDRLHLERMFLYNVVYDTKNELPVLVSGVQAVGESSARVFSRYFVFPEYRTDPSSTNLFAKIDDFEVLNHDLLASASEFSFIFWTRDKGARFFERLKKARADVFTDWEVYPSTVELLYEGNHQGVFYLNQTGDSAEKIIRRDLAFRRS